MPPHLRRLLIAALMAGTCACARHPVSRDGEALALLPQPVLVREGSPQQVVLPGLAPGE
ncbi:hypothetical protein [Corallococcus exercitus]|uniref:hypothetical protein n=1 Tax=Corallococcus exercitus TaxID=2316736 RepID=UPI0013156901|nr:hypothetical protein [Corallococcus exercitus]